jgi:1-pyrroline-5-carboxylate dehydrogenase
MTLANYKPVYPINEPILEYIPGSPERANLKKALQEQLDTSVEVPLIIGGKEVKTGKTKPMICPHNHSKQLGVFHQGNTETVNQAIEAALAARPAWEAMPWEERAAIFYKAADLISTRYRGKLNAVTMLNQSKNVMQAEIDSACEIIDFLRFNCYYMHQIYSEQPMAASKGTWSRTEHRPLEGFVFAVTPFNFTAIGGNLPTAPAMLGNVVVWKPASTAVLAAYTFMQILKEAGLPDGVINLVPGSGATIGDPVLASPHLAGIHFTGSTGVFNNIWKTIGENLSKNIYRTYPRIVGETGGKDFVIAYKDANVDEVSVGLFRGAFEYQGQKCSAASRAYIPQSMWPKVVENLNRYASEINMGDVTDFTTFMGAVIDKNSYDNIVSYIEHAKKASDAKIVVGGNYDDSTGYFVAPTVIETTNPKYKSIEEEIFGPVLTVYVYPDDKFEETCELLDQTSIYALTGAVFAKDRGIIELAKQKLRNAAGNFYINDKPTGAVVGQQPFGGARMSGTNDKAGSYLNMIRWVSARTIKENFVSPRDYTYPHMQQEEPNNVNAKQKITA